ncbi:hypothetical protein ACR30L_08765 [Psychromonas sp. PT13]|uniref:hypothetical protein n=1 Tax=Psychromonas sp. PT13 TaxID=3439547 RepID=UPI003EB91930
MKKIHSIFISACLILSFIATSTASTITDTVEQNIYLSTWQTYHYTHDLTDNDFVLGNALSATLSINLYDDNIGLWFLPDGPEKTLFVIENFDFDTGGVTFGANDFYNDLGIQALGAINYNGLLDITVTSLYGDFFIGDSVLTVDVPAPTSIAILLCALLAFGVNQSRKAKR